jgi:hypothetical protein
MIVKHEWLIWLQCSKRQHLITMIAIDGSKEPVILLIIIANNQKTIIKINNSKVS